MAKKPAAVKSSFNIALLAQIASGDVTYIGQTPDAIAMVSANPALIEVNTSQLDPQGNAACRITEAGKALLASSQNPENSSDGPAPAAAAVASPYQVMSGIEIPKSKRGNKGAGAPTQYPFDSMEIGQFIYVPISDKHPDPVKNLGSTISSVNAKYAEATGEQKTVNRTKRGPGNKAVKDDAGNNVKETVSVPVKKPTRKYVIRAVKGGTAYGSFTPEKDGAIIARVAVI